MKRYPVTITNRLSFLADIVTITPYFKDFLSKSFGIEAVDAATINRTVFIFALIIFVTTLIWLYIDKKLSQAGTRKIACTLSAYKTYKIYNKSNKWFLYKFWIYIFSNMDRSIWYSKEKNFNDVFITNGFSYRNDYWL